MDKRKQLDIKVGQVYSTPFTKTPWVVEKIEENEGDHDWIYFNLWGEHVIRQWRITVNKHLKLIAEFPTVEEALEYTIKEREDNEGN